MSYETHPPLVTPKTIFDTTGPTTQAPGLHLGDRFAFADGRSYHYTLMGVTLGVAGNLYASRTFVANHNNRAPATVGAVGAFVADIVTGATAVVANEYADGWYNVNASTGNKQFYKISGHLAAAAAGATLVVNLYDSIRTATVIATSKVGLVYNPYYKVVITQAPSTTQVVGVDVVGMALSSYGFLQTWGPCSVLCSGTTQNGWEVGAATVAGATVIYAVASGPKVGVMMETAVDTEYRMVYLMIAP